MKVFSLLRRFRTKIHRQRLLNAINGGQHLHLEGIVNVIAPERLNIGKSVYIGDRCYFNCHGGVTIGDYSILSRNVTIYSYNHNFNSENLLPYGPEKIYKPVKIGRYVWVGMNVSIAPGSRIGDGAIIGLNTVVSGDVPENAILVGAKPRIVGYRDALVVSRIERRNGFYTRCFFKD